MSTKPPASTSRVQSMKSKFESLVNSASVDIPSNIKKLPIKPLFQRSHTCINLKTHSETSKDFIRKYSKSNNIENPLQKQCSDSIVLRKNFNNPLTASLRVNRDSKDEALKLIRHSSDSSKRGSIKRSPAFRVGDKNNKAVLTKLSPTTPPEFDDVKFEQLLQRCSTDNQKLQQAGLGLTDTLKFALKQPLPAGPPPKKPPRTFESPIKELNIVEQFGERLKEEANNELKEKIDFLEDNLNLKKEPKKVTKSKENIIPTTNFLSCINCTNTDSIYEQFNNENKPERKNQKLVSDEFLAKRFPKSNNPAEHIYMIPFSHLKINKKNDVPEIVDSGKIDEKLENSEKKDLHYLCTTLNDRLSPVSETEQNVSFGSLNTYDEINLLVNAAFNEQVRDSGHFSMGNSPDKDSASVTENKKQNVKLSRSLTEKRKTYVRSISTTNGQTPNSPAYGTLNRSTFKSPIIKTFSVEVDDNCNDSSSVESTSDRINKYKQLVENNGNVKTTTPNDVVILRKKSKPEIFKDDSHSDNESENNSIKLFNMCLLIGYNISTHLPYIKSKYPADDDPPQNIEHLVFPSKELLHQGKDNQDYSLVLTDDNGLRIYGYCRRVLPESSEICLPLAYCMISEKKAPGFYFKILKEIESRHGQTDYQSNFLLKTLQNRSLPDGGKFLHVKLPLSPRPKSIFMSNHKISPKRLSLEANPKWLTETAAHQMESVFSEMEEKLGSNNNNTLGKKSGMKSLVQEFEEKKQLDKPPFDLNLINRSLYSPKSDDIYIRRPNDLRLESTELSDLFRSLGAEILLNVFGTLLLERKVILYSKSISLLSSCVLGLQTTMYPFQWQHTLVTILPQGLVEICQAPFPLLAGSLEEITMEIEDGIIVNLDTREMTFMCGDEASILPASLKSSLRVSLEMVDFLDQGKMLSSVLIAEAFLRFFVELFGSAKMDLKSFEKESFIQSHPCPSVRLFLEWFVETSMFRHFIQSRVDQDGDVTDSTYALFDARLLEKAENRTKTAQNIETIMKNCKIINKKAKTFKDRFKDFLNS